jgi:hypothetical protein
VGKTSIEVIPGFEFADALRLCVRQSRFERIHTAHWAAYLSPTRGRETRKLSGPLLFAGIAAGYSSRT